MNKEHSHQEKETQKETAHTHADTKKTKKFDFSKLIKPHEARLLLALFVLASVLLNVYFVGKMLLHRNGQGEFLEVFERPPHKMHEFMHHKKAEKMHGASEHNFSFVYCENDDCKRYDKSGEHSISKEEAQRIQKQMAQEFRQTQEEMEKQFDEIERWHKKMMRDLWEW